MELVDERRNRKGTPRNDTALLFLSIKDASGNGNGFGDVMFKVAVAGLVGPAGLMDVSVATPVVASRGRDRPSETTAKVDPAPVVSGSSQIPIPAGEPIDFATAMLQRDAT